ncbi:MAG TPA: DedA family protein [Acidimicrobiales bacterium]|nr:DedA family protein [Acidimicrobiales bacterium]
MEHFVSSWGYPAIFVLTMIEAACIPIPSEITLGLGGALAGGAVVSGGHHLQLAAVILVAVAGEMVGSFAAYMVGRTGGRSLVDRVGRYILLSHKDLDRTQRWFDRRGDPTVLFARMVPLARAFVSFAAGIAEMNPVRFCLYSVIGIAAWVSALASLGYALGGTWHKIVSGFGDATYVMAALAAVGITLAVARRVRAVRAERAVPLS